MTLVTATVEDIVGAPDSTVWRFASILHGDGAEIVTPRWVSYTPVAGVLSIELDPGFATVAFRGKEYVVEVPDSGTHDLWDLLSAAAAFPPGTPPALVGQAVLAYLAAHPEAVEDLVNAGLASIVGGASSTWDTLKEIEDLFGSNESYVAGVTSALALKAPIASPTFTGTVAGITKAMVGLGSVDNTADTAKPVSTVQQAALDLKAPLASPAFTGTPTGITKTHVGLSNVDNTSNATERAATATLGGKTLTSPTITDYTESVVAIGNTSTAKTISLAAGTMQTATLTGNCTFTMPTAAAGKSFSLALATGAGSFTATFTGVKWAAATAPTVTTAASKTDVFTFSCFDGSNWIGSVMQAVA